VKFARARQHLHLLEGELGAYLRAGPFELGQQDDPDTGDLITVVKVARQPPENLCAVIGDAVHNARSALDQLAWYLVERDGGAPDKFTYFPTGETEAKFNKAVREGLRGASDATKERVRDLRVFPGGDDRLWTLHQLDIEDKHRLLIPVGMAHKSVHVGLPGMAGGAGFPVIAIVPEDRQYPVCEGDVLVRVWAKDRHAVESGLMSFGFEFDVAFGRETFVVAGEPVLPTLPLLIDHAEASADGIL
jgi:hypothetical protein